MAGYSTPYAFANYIGEWANDAAALAEIQARKWDSTADGTGTPRNGMTYYATGAHQVRTYIAGIWVWMGTSASSTLDAAYNASAGAAAIAVDAGDVTWNLTGAFSFVVDASACTGAVDGFGVEDGTDYFRARHAAANTLDLTGALGILNIATSGAATIDSDAAATFKGATVAIDADGGVATIDATGAVSINSSAAAINIGNNAIAQAINVGTAGARTITIGNATGVTAVGIKSGTGGINLHDGIAQLNLDGAGALTEVALASANITPSGALTLRGGGASQFGDDTGYFAFDGAGALSMSGVTTVDFDCSGALQINSSGGAIGLGNDNVDQDINIGILGARTIKIGSATATALDFDADGSIKIDSITSNISIDAHATSNFSVNLSGGHITVECFGGGLQKAMFRSAGTGVNAVEISATAGGVSVDAIKSSDFTVTGAAQNLALAVAGGGAQRLMMSSAGTEAAAAGIGAIDITATAGGVAIDAVKASHFIVSGGTADLTFGARGSTIALNAAAPDDALVGFTATSIIGAFNELKNESFLDPLTVVNVAAYTALITDIVLFVTYTDTGACQITIPAAEILKVGRKFIIKDAGLNAGTHNITVVTPGVQLIEEQADMTIDVDGTSITLYSDGTDLYVT